MCTFTVYSENCSSSLLGSYAEMSVDHSNVNPAIFVAKLQVYEFYSYCNVIQYYMYINSVLKCFWL